jgi:hypothetical protein
VIERGQEVKETKMGRYRMERLYHIERDIEREKERN